MSDIAYFVGSLTVILLTMLATDAVLNIEVDGTSFTHAMILAAMFTILRAVRATPKEPTP